MQVSKNMDPCRLVVEFKGAIEGLARKTSRIGTFVDEVVSDVFMHAVERQDKLAFDSERAALAYFLKVARFKILERRRFQRELTLPDAENQIVCPNTTPDPSSRPSLRDVYKYCTELEIKMLDLRRENYRWNAIARILNTTEYAAKQRFSRLIRRLRDRFASQSAPE